MKKLTFTFLLVASILTVHGQAKIEKVFGISLGSNIETVRQKLREKDFPESTVDHSYLFYENIYYGNFPKFKGNFKFDKEKKLMQVWLVRTVHSEKAEAIQLYNGIVAELTKKYGNPMVNPINIKIDPEITDQDFFQLFTQAKPLFRSYWSNDSDNSIEVFISSLGSVLVKYTNNKLFNQMAEADAAEKKKTVSDY